MASEETDYPIDLFLYFKIILSSFVCKLNLIFLKIRYLIQNLDVLTYLTNPIYKHSSPNQSLFFHVPCSKENKIRVKWVKMHSVIALASLSTQ